MKTSLKILIYGLLCVSLHASALQMDMPVVCGHETPGVQDDAIYLQLNYGLYWFKDATTSEGQSVSYCNQDQNKYFDATKKHTMIFVHGFAPFSVAGYKPFIKGNSRFDFDANDIAGPRINDLVAPWLSGTYGDHEPWNVGVFYWNQFADEDPSQLTALGLFQATQAAESKIWTTTSPVNMRWLDNLGVEHAHPAGITQDMAHIFVDQYIKELTDYAKQNPTADFRLVGESLGSQLVIHGARLIADQVNAPGSGLPKNLIPKQVVVLDPVVTYDVDALGVVDDSRMDTLLKDVDSLAPAVIFSGYRTSEAGVHHDVPGSNEMAFNNLGYILAGEDAPLGGISDNSNLLKKMAFVDMKPSACIYPDQTGPAGVLSSKNQHTFGIWWYLLSYTQDSIPLSDQAGSAPFAGMSDDDLKKYMNGPLKAVSDDTGLVPGEGICQEDPDSIGKEWTSWRMKTADKNAPR